MARRGVPPVVIAIDGERAAPLRVAMLVGAGLSTNVTYNALSSSVEVVQVIREERVPASQMIRRRLKRLGVTAVVGQLLFIAMNRLMAFRGRRQRASLIDRYALDTREIPPSLVQRVRSVNDPATIAALQRLAPDAVVINGTRIISEAVLSAVEVPFLNTHMGITPRYRGVHGGYWALANGDAEHCGVTVHVVDRGIDTGGVVYQQTIAAGPEDDFNTYPIHQLAAGTQLMAAALRDLREGTFVVGPAVGPSRLYYHPSIVEYLATWIKRGVR